MHGNAGGAGACGAAGCAGDEGARTGVEGVGAAGSRRCALFGVSITRRSGRATAVSPLNGRVVKVLKSPLEFAKAGDPVLEIQATDRVRVEGKLDIQYDGLVKRGMRVVVEPNRPSCR